MLSALCQSAPAVYGGRLGVCVCSLCIQGSGAVLTNCWFFRREFRYLPILLYIVSRCDGCTVVAKWDKRWYERYDPLKRSCFHYTSSHVYCIGVQASRRLCRKGSLMPEFQHPVRLPSPRRTAGMARRAGAQPTGNFVKLKTSVGAFWRTQQ